MLKRYGNVEESEMIRTFNLGVGMALVTSEGNKDHIMKHLKDQNLNCFEIGRIVKGNKTVFCNGRISWE